MPAVPDPRPGAPKLAPFRADVSPPQSRCRRLFVGGCERSGTTFLAAEIARWTGLTCLPESYFLIPVLRALHRDPTADPAELVRRQWRFGAWGLSDEEVRAAAHDHTDFASFWDGLAAAYAISAEGTAAPGGWVEHTPASTANVALLDHHFPGVRYVNVVRDGRAVAASILRTDFGPATISQAAVWWQAHVLPGLLAHLRDQDRVLMVRYEDLLAEREACRDRIRAFLGAEDAPAAGRHPAALDPLFHKTHRLVGSPGDPDRIDAWRSELSPKQIEQFESIAGGALSALGYELEYGLAARHRPLRRYADGLADSLLCILWKLPRRWLNRHVSSLRRRRARAGSSERTVESSAASRPATDSARSDA